jgi:DNA-binding NarL/FixJ family response regulator
VSSEPVARRPTVLLADDHAATSEQLRRLLQVHFDVVGQSADGAALVAAEAALKPDAIVTDLSMPGLDGIDATTLIRQRHPDARIVLVTVHAEPVLMDQGLAAGALGYVLKDSAGDELVIAVYAALNGRHFISRSLRGNP